MRLALRIESRPRKSTDRAFFSGDDDAADGRDDDDEGAILSASRRAASVQESGYDSSNRLP